LKRRGHGLDVRHTAPSMPGGVEPTSQGGRLAASGGLVDVAAVDVDGRGSREPMSPGV